jgi:transposase
MRSEVEIRLGPGDRERLEAVVADRNAVQKHVWRARIILATADGYGTAEIMRRAGVSKPCVWRWQRRFMEAGVDGLLHDKSRKPGKAPIAEPVVAQLIALTLAAPPGETTHWTSRAMTQAIGLAVSTVQKIWRAHGFALARHPRWTFHFTPTSASWLNAVEGFFAKLTRRRLQRGVFHSLVDLQAAINRYRSEHNHSPKPFAWTADPDRIIAAANRVYQVLDSIH